MTAIEGSPKKEVGHRVYRVILLLLAGIFSYVALILPIASRPDSLPIQVGSVAPSDIIAPRTETFTSEVATLKAKEDAANSVAPIYLAADPTINRGQLEKLNKSLNFISSVRNDQYSSEAQKINDLLKIENLSLSPEHSRQLLGLNKEQWILVQGESLRVLEQVMRENIRDYQVQEKTNSLPGFISYSLTQDESLIVQALVIPNIVPNSLFSDTETELARQKAADEVAPITKTYAENQAIVIRGQVISADQFEALNHFNLIRPERRSLDYIAPAAIVLVLLIFTALFFSLRKNSALLDLRSLAVIAIFFIAFLFSAKFIIPNRTILPYFFPLPAFSLILVALFDLELSFIFPMVLAILVTYGVSSSLELTIFYIFTSLIGAIVLGKGKNFANFMWAAFSITISGILVVTAYRLTNPLTDMIGLLSLYGAIALNGFASASLALLLQFLLSQILAIPTPMYLTELSRSDNPLLRQILQKAPGTYQHSLQVANLAEQAATAIGADALLTRVGSYYHDAGKSVNASFFVENQLPGHLDSHDDMDPIIAAQTIIAHVNYGIALAKKFHLPPRIQDFIKEHHGGQLTRYQYSRAVEQQNGDASLVDIELFRYPGPKPRSKETAILMVADISEARSRSSPPKNEEELHNLLKTIFDFIVKEGTLENTNLTLQDLSQIQLSFQNTIMNNYHPRIKYPEDKVDISQDHVSK